MRRALLLALAVLPLAAFDCGGSPPPQDPVHCTLAVRGAVNEDLWCIVTVYDYSAMPGLPAGASDTFVFMLVAYRGGMTSMEQGGSMDFWLPARASTGVAYGFDPARTWNDVDWANATRWATDAMGPYATHTADSLPSPGTGAVSVTLTSIPPATAQGAELLNVHGSATATVPTATTGGAVTFTATF